MDKSTKRAAQVPSHETAVLCTAVEGSRAAAVGELVVRSRKVDLFWTRLWDGGGYIVLDDALGRLRKLCHRQNHLMEACGRGLRRNRSRAVTVGKVTEWPRNCKVVGPPLWRRPQEVCGVLPVDEVAGPCRQPMSGRTAAGVTAAGQSVAYTAVGPRSHPKRASRRTTAGPSGACGTTLR